MGNRAGRKRKQGRRTASGALARTPRIDKGCDGVVRRQMMFGVMAINDNRKTIMVDGSQTFDALGRAWSAGLLGSVDRSNRYRDSGRVIATQYWRVFGFATPDSLARFQPSLGVGIPDPEKDRIREDALNDALDIVKRQGRDVASAFTQLVIDINPDHGPAWLDRIIYAQRKAKTPDEGDTAMLRLALIGLQAVC